MILPDVNVLVYSHREDVPTHERYREWLTRTLAGPQVFGLSDLVLSGFLRVVTHPRIFVNPTPLEVALAFTQMLREQPNALIVRPGLRHWGIFEALCRDAGARGNLIPDAYLAALAIETGSEFMTADRDFARFPGLRWRHPLL